MPRLIAVRFADGHWECHAESRPHFVMRGDTPAQAMAKICALAGLAREHYALAESAPSRVVYAPRPNRRPPAPCPDCGGTGTYVGLNVVEDCPTCRGAGHTAPP